MTEREVAGRLNLLGRCGWCDTDHSKGICEEAARADVELANERNLEWWAE